MKLAAKGFNTSLTREADFKFKPFLFKNIHKIGVVIRYEATYPITRPATLNSSVKVLKK